MRVPIRKPGKYTHDKTDPHITRERFDELKADLERLKKRIHPSLRAEVERLALFGDFSENAEYQIAKGKLRGVNRRIDEIEDLLKRAVIIKSPAGGTVQLGSTVEIEMDGRAKTYQILGSTETDPSRGIISHNSPLGSALMGRKAGDSFTASIGGRERSIRINKVE